MFPDTDANTLCKIQHLNNLYMEQKHYTKVTATNRRQIVPNDNYYYEEAQQQIASPINETNNLSGNKSMTYEVVFSKSKRKRITCN